MTQSKRKFVGVFAILVLLIAYPLAILGVTDMLPGPMPPLFQVIYYAVAGLFWALPAGLVIKWMLRPD